MRGLESLIPQKKNTGENSGKKESVFSIETDSIRSNPYQPRREFDQHVHVAVGTKIVTQDGAKIGRASCRERV